MTPEQLGIYAGVILSLALFYIPGLSTWYEAKDKQTKALIMAGLLLLSALGIFGLSCAAWISAVTCDAAGAKQLVNILVAALIANQATFMIAVRPFQKERVYRSDGSEVERA